jgi:cell fate (sporulation/competence/biofilm development) regulator YlbF (YheA/YmcA/DUF963 family)
MTDKLYKSLLALKDTLDNHPEVIHLNMLETNLSKEPTCADLLVKYNTLQTKLNNELQFVDIEHYEVRALRKELAAIKGKLDANPFVAKYNAQYKKVAAIYKQVSAALFDKYCAKKGFICQ